MQNKEIFVTNCGESFLLGKRICPPQCPFIVLDSVWSCVGACVVGENCSAYNPSLRYADAKTWTCRPCSVAGCDVCRETNINSGLGLLRGERKYISQNQNFLNQNDLSYSGSLQTSCTKCLKGFKLSPDKSECYIFSDQIALVIIVLFLTIVLVLLVYLIFFICKNKNSLNLDVFKLALRHQSFSKFRDRTKKANPPYPLSTNLSKVNIGGIGIMLYFRFILLLSIVAFLEFSLLLTFYIFSNVVVADSSNNYFDLIFNSKDAFFQNFFFFSDKKYYNQNFHFLQPSLKTKHVFNGFTSHSYQDTFTKRRLGAVNIMNWNIEELKKTCPEIHNIKKDDMNLGKESLLVSLLSNSTEVLNKYKILLFLSSGIIYLVIILYTFYHIKEVRKFAKEIYEQHHGMAHYVALVNNIPEDVVDEYELKKHIEKILNFEIVGVSIFYDYNKYISEVRQLSEQQIEWADLNMGLIHKNVTYHNNDSTNLEATIFENKKLYRKLNILHPIKKSNAIDILKDLKCSGFAALVFKRKNDMKTAVKLFSKLKELLRKSSSGNSESQACKYLCLSNCVSNSNLDDSHSGFYNQGIQSFLSSEEFKHNDDGVNAGEIELIERNNKGSDTQKIHKYDSSLCSTEKHNSNVDKEKKNKEYSIENNKIESSEELEYCRDIKILLPNNSYIDTMEFQIEDLDKRVNEIISNVESLSDLENRFFYGKTLLELSEFDVEPINVLFENFSVGNFERVIRSLIAIVILIFLLLIWSALFYTPYTLYSASFAAGSRGPGTLQNLLLGGFIGAGNAILAEIVQSLVKWIRFTRVELHDTFVFVATYISIQLNVFFNVIIAYTVSSRQQPSSLSAFGYLFQNNYYSNFYYHDKIINSKVKFDATHAVGTEIIFIQAFTAYVIPGVLLLPPIFSILTIYVIPFVLNAFNVLYMSSFSLRTAEKKLECPGCNLSLKYSELMVGFTTCTMLLYFICDLKLCLLTILCLLFMFLFINYRDTFLFLRMTKETYFTTNHLDDAVLRIWCFPTAILAASPLYWLWRADIVPFYFIFLTVLIHVFLYNLICSFLIPTCVSSSYNTLDVDYFTVSKRIPFNWFNTNPVLVLKKFYSNPFLNFDDDENKNGEDNQNEKEIHCDNIAGLRDNIKSRNYIYNFIIYFQTGKEYLQASHFSEYEPHKNEAKELLENVTNKLINVRNSYTAFSPTPLHIDE